MKTYNQVSKELYGMDSNHPAKSAQLELISEYGEFNHIHCVGIVSALIDWNYDYDRDCKDADYEAPDPDKKRIQALAQKIHDRGDLHTLQMNYYVMLHFLAEDTLTKVKVKHLAWILDGVGDWKH